MCATCRSSSWTTDGSKHRSFSALTGLSALHPWQAVLYRINAFESKDGWAELPQHQSYGGRSVKLVMPVDAQRSN